MAGQSHRGYMSLERSFNPGAERTTGIDSACGVVGGNEKGATYARESSLRNVPQKLFFRIVWAIIEFVS